MLFYFKPKIIFTLQTMSLNNKKSLLFSHKISEKNFQKKKSMPNLEKANR
jgi:hypothetical protein